MMLRTCCSHRGARASLRGSARIVLALAVLFLVGGFLGGYLVYQSLRHPAPVSDAPAGETPLSEATLNTLARLQSPVEIRFYSIVPSEAVPESTRALVDQVDALLAAYQAQAGERIILKRIQTAQGLKAAQEDGLTAFSLGEQPCFLGLAVVRGSQKEVLPLLSAEWAQAVEPDLTRAIQRLADTAPAVPGSGSQISAAALQEVQRAIPNPAELSLEDGKRLLRETALKEFQAAAREMQAQIKEAETQLQQAQAGGSSADQQAAIQRLQTLQTTQTENLQEMAAGLQDRIAAWESLKRQ